MMSAAEPDGAPSAPAERQHHVSLTADCIGPLFSGRGGGRAYYNENDSYAAQWLRNLVAAGHLPAGDVDERSILDVQADDLRPFRQCHFFAGIGGWPYALRLAGWPDDEPVWSGSCPCQPLSSAGKRRGHADERHLWPAFHGLIAECRPPVVFGEQVASADGREWFAAVRSDLEDLGYACGAADLCAASCGAPHIRQRLFFVAHAGHGPRGNAGELSGAVGADARAASGQGRDGLDRSAAHRGADGELVDPDRCGPPAGRAAAAVMGHGGAAVTAGGDDGLGDACRAGLAGRPRQSRDDGAERAAAQRAGCWSDLVWLPCTDGKARPTQPGLQPLAHGVPGRVGRLRAYGNAIVPQVAAVFVKAARDMIA